MNNNKHELIKMYDPWGNVNDEKMGDFSQVQVSYLYSVWRDKANEGFFMGGFKDYVEMYAENHVEDLEELEEA